MTRPKDEPHHTGNGGGGGRKISWGMMTLGIVLFVFGLGLFLTTYSNNAVACYIGAAVALLSFLACVITAIRGDRRHHRTDGNGA